MRKGLSKIVIACISTILTTSYGYSARIMNENPAKEDWECKIVDGEWNCARENDPVNVFDKDIPAKERDKALATDMGWIPNKSYRTGGEYFNDMEFTKPLCDSGKTDLSYENAEFDTDGTLIATGNVEVLQCDQEIYGDNAIITFNDDKSGVEGVSILGNVISKQPSTGIVFRTNELLSNLEDGTSSSGETYFRFFKKTPDTPIYNKEHFTGHLRGYAISMKRYDENNISMIDGYVTSGGPYDNDWKMAADNIDIDLNENMTYMRGGVFKIKDVPVMYVPYMAYPTNDARRSGLLTPTFFQNDKSGWAINQPYYFNLAPNYDLLFNQTYWLKRGPMEGGNFRYLTEYFEGNFEGALVPYDYITKTTRGAFTLNNKGDFKNGIKSNFKYDYVSDGAFYDDFAAGEINLVTKTLLDREFDLSYNDTNFDLAGQFLFYGVVNQNLTLQNMPYAKLPDIKAKVNASNWLPEYIDLEADTQNTYFYKAPRVTEDPSKVTQPKVGSQVDGFRGYESPKAGLNLTDSWYFAKPSIEVPIRYYQLNRDMTNQIKFDNSSVTSVIPIFNIDSGLYFDREFSTSKGAYSQSLEPRLFYTYIPYQNQRDIPIYDTNLTNEQYMQMFEVNRFVGRDRINNANQLTYAFESKTLNNDDGSTLAEAKIGQQIFFADRRVSLQQGNEVFNSNMLPQFANSTFSPIMSSFTWNVLDNINISAQVNYRIEENNVDYQVYQVQYKDKNKNIFNLSYNNIANNWAGMTPADIAKGAKPKAQQTITASTMFALTESIGIAALANYNFEQQKFSNAFIGLQYDANSWALRALYQTSAYTNEDPNNSDILGSLTGTYVIQAELKGIGGVYGDSDLSQRVRMISGYEEGMWGV